MVEPMIRAGRGVAKPSQIVKLSSSKQFINLLVYGPPGIGKTPLAGTSPNAVFLEADDGEASLSATGSLAEIWKVRDWNDITEAAEWLRHDGHKVYDWVWLDSGTLFQDAGLDSIMEDLVAEKPHRNRWVPDRPEYGENMNRFKAKIRELKALPMNFGLTAHVTWVEDDGNSIMMPKFQGKDMPQLICAYFDIVGYLDLMRTKTAENQEESARRILRMNASDKFYAKDRFSCTPKGALPDPTIPKLVEAIKKKLSTTNGTVKKAVAKKG